MNNTPIQRIALLGAGSWGTALAILLGRNGLAVRLWGHDPSHIARLLQHRENREFLPGVPLPASITPVAHLHEALENADEVLVVVPSHAFHPVLQEIAAQLREDAGISWATKGFHPCDGRLLHQVATQVLGNRRPLAVISGPTFAQEVARSSPTAVTVASADDDYALRVAGYLHSERFRAYTSNDIVGVQVGGATKNVLAIAAGIADGLGFGANTRAALITRGLAELTRLGVALGAQPRTFMGLAGLGDLALTCTDNQSRNRRLGLALARGLNVAQAQSEIGQEVEGVSAAQSVSRKAQELGIEMPICTQVYRVLYEGILPIEATRTLLDRSIKAEAD
jgi:glycerol-3-phosphate dehydrogenase (NAD(P)+)